jgi:hypothetical protein
MFAVTLRIILRDSLGDILIDISSLMTSDEAQLHLQNILRANNPDQEQLVRTTEQRHALKTTLFENSLNISAWADTN